MKNGYFADICSGTGVVAKAPRSDGTPPVSGIIIMGQVAASLSMSSAIVHALMARDLAELRSSGVKY